MFFPHRFFSMFFPHGLHTFLYNQSVLTVNSLEFLAELGELCKMLQPTGRTPNVSGTL